MNFMIDGHNLIAKMPGMALSMPDDEQQLIELLVRYCRRGGHKVEVYFDAAPVGQAGGPVKGGQSYGRVRAHFVSQRSSADEAIRRRVKALGKAARNWVVVSSDRAVQSAAREAHAEVIEAEAFAARLTAALQEAEETTKSTDQPLSEAEVKEWEAIFRGKKKPGG